MDIGNHREKGNLSTDHIVNRRSRQQGRAVKKTQNGVEKGFASCVRERPVNDISCDTD